MTKDRLSTFLKIIVSAGLLGYLLYRFLSDPADRTLLLDTLTTANYWYLILAVALFVLAMFSNAVKWHILSRAQGVNVSLKAVTNYTFVGFFFNNFLPANVGGDVMRGFGMARHTENNADAAVSVIVDRIIGLIAFMFTAVVAVLIAVLLVKTGTANNLLQADDNLLENLAQVEWLAIAGMVVIAGIFMVMLSDRLRTLVGKIFTISFLKVLSPLYENISGAFGAYRHEYSALFGAFAVGVGTVLLTGLVDLAIVAGLNGSIPPLYIFLFNPIIAVLLIAPISIGGLGTGSLLYVYFYGLVGVPQTLAFALSLIKQAVVYIGSLPGGLLWLQRRQSSSD